MVDLPDWLKEEENEEEATPHYPTYPGREYFQAFARRGDPDTSHIAASTVDANKLEKLVVSTLRQYSNGCTVKEISAILDIDKWSISPRMKPLEEKGLVERTLERKDHSIIWRVSSGG